MAQRTVALCDGKFIGIESIYTVIDGKQINIPDKLEQLRAKSRNNELFCPCGCGANLVLVAGERNLREQHFRIKEGFDGICQMPVEGINSIDSKIALKCWLEDKLHTDDIESRVPIRTVSESERKYEFTFMSAKKKVALSFAMNTVIYLMINLLFLNSIAMVIQLFMLRQGINPKQMDSTGRVNENSEETGYCLL